ncbi:hypothetical protein BBF96_11255 [Anoxybacter fermentans]|uniref:Polysaccharide chain length determinant N-terminal domain-containing protein n=1 Tax=Anoxybacter fermentans TaxID=1323375 RepID=A0A3S9T076_9FIRM|nr:Wzz/FepE/Etk N-terminal domain-containing protein [Anoxybacter fermentans]AZR73917.1 hypothetical protein BBF96_11255 [Anoxybacter fermentans]
METYEIDLWELLQTLNRRKMLIIGIVFVSVIMSYVFSAFFIDKQYQTEMWIRLNENFLPDQKEIPLEYLKSHFFYPEVIQVITKNLSDIPDLKNSLSFTQVNGLVQIVYTHTFDSKAPQLLQKWTTIARLKLIEEEGTRLIATLENDISTTQTKLAKEEQNLEEIKKLLLKESQFIEVEVVPKDTTEPKTFVYKELNPNYTDLKTEEKNIKLEIVKLKNQIKLLEQVLEEYKVILTEVNKNLDATEVNTNKLFNDLNKLRIKFNAIYSNRSIEPFQVVSAPYSNPNPISPNVKLNVLLAGFLGLFVGVFLAFFLEYVKTMKEQNQSQTVV